MNLFEDGIVCPKRGDWITNNPKTIKSWWPRRKTKYKEGPPKETSTYTVEDLKFMGYIGIYLDEDVEDYYNLPIVKNQNEI